MFVPYTLYSEVAKELREAEEKLESMTGYRLKVVERAGAKLEDLLHTSYPWRGKDCGRELCMLCSTKEKLASLKSYTARREVWYIRYGALNARREEDRG